DPVAECAIAAINTPALFDCGGLRGSVDGTQYRQEKENADSHTVVRLLYGALDGQPILADVGLNFRSVRDDPVADAPDDGSILLNSGLEFLVRGDIQFL